MTVFKLVDAQRFAKLALGLSFALMAGIVTGWVHL